MPNKKGVLTPREKRFAERYAVLGDPTAAAAAAGYAQPQPRGSDNLRNPAVMAEARRITLDVLSNEILPLALKRHVQLLSDPETRGPTLTKAIEIAYKHGLAQRPEDDERPLSELTADELNARAERGRALVDALEREASDRAKPVLDGSAEDGVFG